jgi:hypothetical protein
MKKLDSLFLLLIVFAVSGCSSVPVKRGEIARGEYQNAAIIMFSEEDLSIEGEPDLFVGEKNIVSCLENRIKKHNPDQAFISYYQFVNTIFSDLPDREVPREPESFSRFLTDVADEKFYKDVLSWGVRYLIFVSGSNRRTNESEGSFVSFPLFLLYGIEDKKTRLTASILDLHQKETVIDGLENISEGTSWFGIFFPIPIWYSTSTESNACEDMGNRLGKILLERTKQ